MPSRPTSAVHNNKQSENSQAGFSSRPLTSPERKTVATNEVANSGRSRGYAPRHRTLVSDMVSEIEECGDGAEALDAYHRCLPDWVLMDVEMDQLDGITATREILLYPRRGS